VFPSLASTIVPAVWRSKPLESVAPDSVRHAQKKQEFNETESHQSRAEIRGERTGTDKTPKMATMLRADLQQQLHQRRRRPDCPHSAPVLSSTPSTVPLRRMQTSPMMTVERKQRRRNILTTILSIVALLFLFHPTHAAPPHTAAGDAAASKEDADFDAAFDLGLGPEIKEEAHEPLDLGLGPELKEEAHKPTHATVPDATTESPAICPPNTHRVGSLCLPNTGCTAATCSGHGFCSQLDGHVRCHCEPGFVSMGFDGQHCNACDSPSAVYPDCHTKALVDESRRDGISPACAAEILPTNLNDAGLLAPVLSADALAHALESPSPILLRAHSLHLLDWFWINVEAGSHELEFELSFDSIFRLYISNMEQTGSTGPASGGAGGAAGAFGPRGHQTRIEAELGMRDPRLTVVPSLYSAAQFLSSGHTVLDRNEVGIPATVGCRKIQDSPRIRRASDAKFHPFFVPEIQDGDSY
jgi:hypothetical protein